MEYQPFLSGKLLPLLALSFIATALPACDKLKEITKKTPPAAPLKGPVTRELKEADYSAFIQTPGRLSVVVYHASWCGPCKQLEPVLNRVAEEFSQVAQVGRFDVDQCRTLASQNGVNGIPDVRFFVDGKQVDSFMGSLGESDVREKFKAYTRGLKPAEPAAKDPKSPESKENGPTIQPMPKDWKPPGIEKR